MIYFSMARNEDTKCSKLWCVRVQSDVQQIPMP